VVSRWKNFIESINAEKGLTLGPALEGFNLISLKENNLRFTTDKDEDLNTFRLNEKYLAKKSEEFFGRRFNFIASTDNKSDSTNLNKISTKENVPQTHSTDPYEEIIIKELVGTKIA